MEVRNENNGTGSPRGSRETEAKPSAVQKTREYRPRPKQSAAMQQPHHLRRFERIAQIKKPQHERITSWVDPDFDEGL